MFHTAKLHIANRFTVRFRSLNRWLVSACILALASHATPSAAQQQNVLATVTAEERAACKPDVLRLCSAAIPNVSRVIACMKRERPRLSPACAAVVDARLGQTRTATRSIVLSRVE